MQDTEMVLVRSPQAVLDLVRAEAIGHVVNVLEVYGINSLKSVVPPISEVRGRSVDAAHFDSEARLVLLLAGDLVLRINLERTGGLTVVRTTQVWTPGATGTPPTARLLLQTGRGLDFREPGRTKRITFDLAQGGPDVGSSTPLAQPELR